MLGARADHDCRAAIAALSATRLRARLSTTRCVVAGIVAGTPMVGWTMYRQDAVKVTKGTPKVYASSENGRRHFCSDCRTGLFYTNTEEVLSGIIDIQSATYDDPDAVPAQAHIQVAERIRWMA